MADWGIVWVGSMRHSGLHDLCRTPLRAWQLHCLCVAFMTALQALSRVLAQARRSPGTDC